MANDKKIFEKWDNSGIHLLDVAEHFIFRWKSQARACVENKVSYLRFEDWLTNKSVREDFLYREFKLKDIFGIDNIQGTTSSFGDREKVLSRLNDVEIPEETKKLIRKDSELHYLLAKMGYDYIKI
jgi:hypothetical protein